MPRPVDAALSSRILVTGQLSPGRLASGILAGVLTNSTLVWSCIVAAALSALAHLRAEYRGPSWLIYVAKPLTTALLIVVAAIASPADSAYRVPVLIGLMFSLAGDVFLMLPRDRFILGLLSFLVAHVAYIVAFRTAVPFASRPLLLLPYAVATALVLRLLWPRLGKLRVPVLVYVLALVLMAWQAAIRASLLPSPPTIAAAVGAALFVISDATLAMNRFHTKFRAAQVVIMTTYVTAQALIALSVWNR